MSIPRVLFLAAVCGLFVAVSASVQAATFSIADSTTLFTPSTRGQANTTYFGWSIGNWDGNADETVDTLNSTPNLTGSATSAQGSLVQNNVYDIVSSSNNLYAGPSRFDLTLHIPTSGTVGGGGSTTIILQGLGLSGSSFGGAAGGMDTFIFGDINGISPTYVGGANFIGNANGQTQFWAEYHIPGNLSAYDVKVLASTVGLGVVSITDFSVDTWYSPDANTYGPDLAVVPEPAGAILGVLSLLGFLGRRRRK